MAKHIVPQYKLVLRYDLATEELEEYYQFVMSEMIPTVHEMDLYIFRAFHIIPGPANNDHRLRHVEYIAEELEVIETVLKSEKWEELETKLLEYVTNYDRRIIRFRQGFQL